MKLKSVTFYQSVKLWDNQEYKKINDGSNGSGSQKINVEIFLMDHMVTLKCEGRDIEILVPTANMRLAERTIEEAPLLPGGFVEYKSPMVPMSPAAKLAVVTELMNDPENPITPKQAAEVMNFDPGKYLNTDDEPEETKAEPAPTEASKAAVQPHKHRYDEKTGKCKICGKVKDA